MILYFIIGFVLAVFNVFLLENKIAEGNEKYNLGEMLKAILFIFMTYFLVWPLIILLDETW